MDLSASNKNGRLIVLFEIKMLKSTTGCERFIVSVYIFRPKLLSFFAGPALKGSLKRTLLSIFLFSYDIRIYMPQLITTENEGLTRVQH